MYDFRDAQLLHGVVGPVSDDPVIQEKILQNPAILSGGPVIAGTIRGGGQQTQDTSQTSLLGGWEPEGVFARGLSQHIRVGAGHPKGGLGQTDAALKISLGYLFAGVHFQQTVGHFSAPGLIAFAAQLEQECGEFPAFLLGQADGSLF
ncbi:MAG: hypothetical protein ABSH19_03115 [Opitutales bacterium]